MITKYGTVPGQISKTASGTEPTPPKPDPVKPAPVKPVPTDPKNPKLKPELTPA